MTSMYEPSRFRQKYKDLIEWITRNDIAGKIENYTDYGDVSSQSLFRAFIDNQSVNTPQCCHILAVHFEKVSRHLLELANFQDFI